eukprot:Gregarina_sp_Poly_1__3294@NODE_1946_length_3023_cov_243_550406_g346_i1_p1_GENE_NODE_1946_length_3023_cov_243_550406_g346_i1NODE_1946_length_3023_cov_243_550406_g346_i1_p1_ORF_typecomplete_len235_score32_98EntA_Immun/PF08951_10/0_15_NODE_1946_length_3023_cov_243_550406_g346_i117452449
MNYIRDISDRINRLEGILHSLSKGLTPDFEKRLLVSVSTALEDHMDSQVLANQMVNAIVPALERWWTSKTAKPSAPVRLPMASPPALLPSSSPNGQKRFSLLGNRSVGIGRTPGNCSLLTDSLSFSENGTEWGNNSQMFCTPHTTILIPNHRPNGIQDVWDKSAELPDKFTLQHASDPPTLNPIKEGKSPLSREISRETTAQVTPAADCRIPPALGTGEETPKPSSKTQSSSPP